MMSVQSTPVWSRAWSAPSEWDNASTGPPVQEEQSWSSRKTDVAISTFTVAFWSAILLWAGTGFDPLEWLQ